MNNETKKPQPGFGRSPSNEHDLLEGIHFEASTESTKNEPTPERVREEKERQSKK